MDFSWHSSYYSFLNNQLVSLSNGLTLGRDPRRHEVVATNSLSLQVGWDRPPLASRLNNPENISTSFFGRRSQANVVHPAILETHPRWTPYDLAQLNPFLVCRAKNGLPAISLFLPQRRLTHLFRWLPEWVRYEP